MKKIKKDRLLLKRILVLGLLLLVLGLSVLAFIADINSEPHFIIYEEVCRNETSYTIIGRIDTSLIVLGLEEVPVIPDNARFSCPTNSNICRIYILENKTICEQVEVDEMRLVQEWFVDRVGNSSECREYYKKNNLPFTISDGGTCTLMDVEYNKYTVSKQDLTIEWLDENCLCWGDVNQNQEDIYEKCDFPKVIAKGTPAETIIKGTTEYKCEDKYIVKVWNQFK